MLLIAKVANHAPHRDYLLTDRFEPKLYNSSHFENYNQIAATADLVLAFLLDF